MIKLIIKIVVRITIIQSITLSVPKILIQKYSVLACNRIFLTFRKQTYKFDIQAILHETEADENTKLNIFPVGIFHL